MGPKGRVNENKSQDRHDTMKPQTISAIHDFSLEARDILEREVSEQLEGIYGLLPDGK